MLSRYVVALPILTCVILAATGSTAFAQFYSGGCSTCGPAPVSMPMAACMPIQPVQTTCYQTVPVTTYAREKQTVEVPYYQTTYEDREYTLYRPVTRQREVEVPTVNYQNVVEYQTVNRDMGRWVTQYQPVQKYSPCQVDPRPGVIGWLNRTGYSFRTAFTPNYTTTRQYVPNMVTCQVPITRQVAVRGTRRVTVAETEMVAERRTEKVPVQKLAYRKEEVTVMRPQTAYRTVPIGTSLAYGPGYGATTAYAPYFGGTATAWGYPIIEDRTRTALSPSPDPLSGSSERSADSSSRFDDGASSGSGDTERRFRRSETPETGENFQRSSQQMFPDDETPAAVQPLDANPFPAGLGPTTKRVSEGLVIPVSLKTFSEAPAEPPAGATAAGDAPAETPATGNWRASTRQPGISTSAGRDSRNSRISLVEIKSGQK